MPAQPNCKAVSDQLGESTDLSQKSEITPFFVQKEEYNKQVEQLVYHTTDDFKNQRLQTAHDANPVLKKYGITAVHLFKEFNQDSYINNEYPTYDYEGYLAFDMYSPDGNHCGLLAFGRKKGLISNNFKDHTVGQNGIVVFNRYGKYADINYCTDNLIIALKIAQCGERVAFAKDINDSIQLYENITNNTPIFIDTLLKDDRAFNLLDPKHVLNLQSKMDIHAYLMTLKNAFIKENGVIAENPITDDVPTTVLGNQFVGNKPQAWGKLLPINHAIDVAENPYPIHALPPLIQHASKAISEYVQAPLAMAVQCVLGAITHLAQAEVNAPILNDISGKGEPCSLFLMTEGKSGSRKSSSRKLADKAITAHERHAYEVYKEVLSQWEDLYQNTPKKERADSILSNPKPSDPSTIFSDLTFESLAGLYIDGVIKNGSLSSDEAGQFFGGHTMKGDTVNNAIGGFTKIYDDGSIQRTRGKSNTNGSGRANDVRLSFNLQGQHEVLAEALKDPLLREQGFLPRFILTVPENLAGERIQDEVFRAKSRNINMDNRLIAYWERCRELLDRHGIPKVISDGEQYAPERTVIPLSIEAEEIDLNFYNECEENQRKGKPYEYIQPFASRASQTARRLATVLSFFEGHTMISGEVMKSSCEVMRHSLKEWLKYSDVETAQESNTQRMIDWLTKKCLSNNTTELFYSVMQSNCPRPMRKNKTILETVLNELVDTNHIQILTISNKRVIQISPFYLELAKKRG